ncbi:MurR/RpiR family transcriptional regulator [Phytoactinopolyspora alkaliphila]|uniref:MurR/RpiR family transcriptional regulator n=1 Tax=Phytoactinopolyspora alkaliphila TaxID=1783498 RepID=A0A6N9YT38_9ACTN|nr:MurR/RpiR family transcriptional regulator [Phytoactinopolyspora alkaliphila]NED97979.1 MurR/RpiR family transcriptional regulator [Phytoactinopolyspora alkaliphila]
MVTDAASRGWSGGVRQHVRALVPTLAPAERRVAEALLADPSVVVEKTITEVAQACQTSETTVVRFCRTAGFRGYPELRLAVATELGRDHARRPQDRAPGTDIGRDDTLEDLVRKVAYTDTRAIEETVDELDLGTLAQVIEAVATARRIYLFGLGASTFAAQDLQQKLLRIDRVALFITDPHLTLASSALMTGDDVAIALSHTGDTAEVVTWLGEARRRDATTIAITNYAKSPLSTHAQLTLITAAQESRFRSGAMASRIAQMAVIDCVYLGVAQRTYDASVAALTTTHDVVHPSHTPPPSP